MYTSAQNTIKNFFGKINFLSDNGFLLNILDSLSTYKTRIL